MELELDFTAFKKNLRDLIESRGLYAKDIAAEINVSTPTLSRYLQGVREPELKYVVLRGSPHRSPRVCHSVRSGLAR